MHPEHKSKKEQLKNNICYQMVNKIPFKESPWQKSELGAPPINDDPKNKANVISQF